MSDEPIYTYGIMDVDGYNSPFKIHCNERVQMSVDKRLFYDAQLFMSLSPNSFSDSMGHLLHVVTQIFSRVTSYLLSLNPLRPGFIHRLYANLENSYYSRKVHILLFPSTLTLHLSIQILLSTIYK